MSIPTTVSEADSLGSCPPPMATTRSVYTSQNLGSPQLAVASSMSTFRGQPSPRTTTSMRQQAQCVKPLRSATRSMYPLGDRTSDREPLRRRVSHCQYRIIERQWCELVDAGNERGDGPIRQRPIRLDSYGGNIASPDTGSSQSWIESIGSLRRSLLGRQQRYPLLH